MESVVSEPIGCLSGRPKLKWNTPIVHTVPASAPGKSSQPPQNLQGGGHKLWSGCPPPHTYTKNKGTKTEEKRPYKLV